MPHNRFALVVASFLFLAAFPSRTAPHGGTSGEPRFAQAGILLDDRLPSAVVHALRIETTPTGLTADDLRLSEGDWISFRCSVAVDRRGGVVDAAVDRVPEVLRRGARSWEEVLDETVPRAAAERLIEAALSALAGASFRAPDLPEGASGEVVRGHVSLRWQAPTEGALSWGSAGIATGQEEDLALFPLP